MLHEHQSVRDDRHSQHLAAVRMSLGWADAAARAGDHADALHWLDVAEEVGDMLSAEYTAKRVAWRRALRGASAGRAADVSATTPARARVGAMTCPRCRPAVAQKAAWLGMVHCPQCLARTRIAVELFSSPLPPDSLYAETPPKAEGLPA